MYPLFFIYSDWALAFVRLVLGVILATHGWPKLKNWKAAASDFNAMGFKPGAFWGPLVSVVEFFGGLALIVGLWTQLVAVLVTVQFLVITIWKLVKRQPFVGGLEFDLLILTAALLLLAQGAGVFSLDRYFFWY